MSREAFEKWLLDQVGLQGTWDSERNCYKEFSCHIAHKAWQAALESHAAQPQVPEGIGAMIDTVENALQDAYHNAGFVCCGKSMINCCGNPVADWGEADKKIMDILGPIHRELSAMLTASQEQPK